MPAAQSSQPSGRRSRVGTSDGTGSAGSAGSTDSAAAAAAGGSAGRGRTRASVLALFTTLTKPSPNAPGGIGGGEATPGSVASRDGGLSGACCITGEDVANLAGALNLDYSPEQVQSMMTMFGEGEPLVMDAKAIESMLRQTKLL